MIQLDEHIFQMGWFNDHLEVIYSKNLFAILESGARNYRLDDDPSPKTGPPFRVVFFVLPKKKHAKTAGENWEQIFGEWGVF